MPLCTIHCRAAAVVGLFVGASSAAAPVALAQAGSPIQYPPAERSDHVDVYHGDRVADPYRWLEALNSERTAEWVGAQNAIARPFLSVLERHGAIKQRLTAVWSYERYSIPIKEGGRYFYRRNDGMQDQDLVYVADALDAEPRVLIDPNRFRDDATIALASYEVSPDGRYIAYGVSDGGTDWKTWRIRDIATGEDFPEVLDYIKFSGVSWQEDATGFYYSRFPVGSDGRGDGSKTVSVYYHRVGTDQANDEMVYSIPDHDDRDAYASLTEDQRYLIINVSVGFSTNAVYYRDLRDPNADVIHLLDAWDARYSFVGNEGSTFYFHTNKSAPRWRLVAVDINTPDPGHWRDIIPESQETLRDVSYVGGRLVGEYLSDAHAMVKVFDTQGLEVREVDLPGIGSVSGFEGDGADPETFYSFTSYTSPRAIFRYDVTTGRSELFRRAEIDMNLDEYETKQIFYTSKDGTRVPMFISHRRGIALDGRNPLLLTGYGGFNISRTPSFSTSRMVWMEMGGVLAIPNLRGGGEYGEEWHEAGTKLKKQNVFDDFIAAAEWLIDNGYTSTPRLAIQGGSNGGLLVGAVMTQRPELFGATLPAVGVMDMLRYHVPSRNARSWSSDYGLSENEDEYHALRAYSPLHNIQSGTCYPPTLVTTADHDDRVVPWHSFKFGAELQYAQGCDKPVLVRVQTRAGHGAGKPTWMRIEEVADQWAFLYEMLRMGTREVLP